MKKLNNLKLSCVVLIVLLFFCAVTLYASGSKNIEDKGSLNVFRMSLKKAVKANDRAAIVSIMAGQFQWASDNKKITSDQALKYMDQNQLWNDFMKALASGKAQKFEDSSCMGECYLLSDPNTKKNAAYVIQKFDGKWIWTEMRGE